MYININIIPERFLFLGIAISLNSILSGLDISVTPVLPDILVTGLGTSGCSLGTCSVRSKEEPKGSPVPKGAIPIYHIQIFRHIYVYIYVFLFIYI
jgi:hypothetical protein